MLLVRLVRWPTMSSSLQVPDNLEEQDIGLYYYSRRSSPTLSDTDISSLMSRSTSQLQLDKVEQIQAAPHATHGPMKSPSLSQVTEMQQDRRLTAPQPILRSRTVPHLPSTGHTNTVDDFPSFTFSEDRVQRMQEWALAFVVGKLDVASRFKVFKRSYI